VLPHRNALQPLVVPAGQLPWPSQNEAALLMLVLVLHVGEPHITLVPGITQLVCVPLQLPWQAPVPAHDPRLGAPLTTPQVPAGVLLEGMPPQYSHDPAQALLQQYPSTQDVPEMQPAATVLQVCPCLLLHVPLASHVPAHRPLGSFALLTDTQV